MQIREHKSVKKFLESLDVSVHARATRLIDMLEKYGSNVRMPYSKPVRSGIFELRVRGTTEVRILYVFEGDAILLLHGCIKKSNRLRHSAIDQALKNRLDLI